ncbi:hypothetical protein FHS27_003567 [Rhodopirellula rubra]|uniref:Uncharacterized protein n=1 Tax=Aporhodopirellula rubra TaxID=980271 RepID=A0A7W5E081_9BACT|nr:hypothetical protein [Aporhodopirellula rubra]
MRACIPERTSPRFSVPKVLNGLDSLSEARTIRDGAFFSETPNFTCERRFFPSLQRIFRFSGKKYAVRFMRMTDTTDPL